MRALKAPRAGASRAARAIRGAGSKLGGGVSKATAGTRSEIAKAGRAVKAGAEKTVAAPRARISSLVQDAREHPTVAVGIAAGALVGIAWISWAIYVTASNGTTAGLGVLLTWPVLIGALALIAAPFILTGMLVKRHWPDGGSGPPIAGGASEEDG
jgi:hypothetical protein